MTGRAKSKRGQTRAVKNALARLGMQTSTQEVVAFLASYGVQVSPTLRRKLLKETPRASRQEVAVTYTGGRLQARLSPKVPPPRHFHR